MNDELNAKLTGSIVLMLVASTILISGCGVVPPRVVYSTYSPSTTVASGGQDSLLFRTRRSVLLISRDPKDGSLQATPSPYEFVAGGTAYATTYSISGVDDWKATTQLKVTYVDNTKFVDQLDVTTKDNVADTIQKIGQVAAAAVPLIAGHVSGTTLPADAKFGPTILDPADTGAQNWQADKINSGYCLRLRDVVPEPGVPMANYMSSRASAPTGDFPVPACVTAVVDVATCTATDVPQSLVAAIQVTYASPDQVTPMPLPSTGQLKMNTVCGAKVTPADKEDRTDVLTYLNNAIKAVSDVQSAIKSSKKKP